MRPVRSIARASAGLGRHLLRHGWGVVATVLALCAMSGAAYAVSRLPANSVGTAQLRRHAVTVPKLGKDAVRTLHGARGPAGPSQIIVKNVKSAPGGTEADGYVPIAAVKVPKGTWHVQASADIFGPAGTDLQCLVDGGSKLYTKYPYYESAISANQTATPIAVAVFRTGTTASATLSCRIQASPNGSSFRASFIQLVAQRVGAASTQH